MATATHAAPAHAPEGHTSTGINNTKLGMWAFLGSECLFFGALISTYLIYRGRSGEGPFPSDVYDIELISSTNELTDVKGMS